MNKSTSLIKCLCVLFALFLTFPTSTCMAKSFITVSEPGKVFDTPSTDYVTLNKKNEEVKLLPGMVFKCLESTNGWSLIEYSPGLRGYVSEQIEAIESKMPQAGSYKVANNPKETVNVKKDGDKWTVTAGTMTYNGSLADNAVIFFDNNGNGVYSLADFGNGGVVMSYDNGITHFF